MSDSPTVPAVASSPWPDAASDNTLGPSPKPSTSTPLSPHPSSLSNIGLANGQRPSVWRESLAMVQAHLPYTRRAVHAKETIYRCGDPFETLYLINCGSCKLLNLAADGRELPVDFCLRGDWLGFDGIGGARHACTAIALDSGELWALSYSALIQASRASPEVMPVLLKALSEQMTQHHDKALSICTLAADARVADFLLHWAQALADRDLRNDEIAVPMTRAEIGSHLGITLESVSRALSKMAQQGVIRFGDNVRRNIGIPSLSTLGAFVQAHTPQQPRGVTEAAAPRLPVPVAWRRRVRPC